MQQELTRLETTAIQRAYFRGRDPELPLGGFDCLAYLEFTGREIDLDRLEAAAAALTGNPFLRARFTGPDVLEEFDAPTLRPAVHDLRGRSQSDAHEEIAATRRRMLSTPLDLESGRTWAMEASRLGDGTTVVHLVISIAIADIAAIGVLASQIARCLATGARPPHRQLHEIATALQVAQRDRPAVSDALVAARPVELFHPPQLPQRSTAAATPDPSDADHPLVERFTTRFDHDEWTLLEDRATALGRTTAALLLTLYERALGRHSSNPEFIVTVTGVDTTGTENIVADRTVTYAHRARPGAADDFTDAVHEVGDDLRYRISVGTEATTELQAALRSGNGHPGISPYVFTIAAKDPIFDDETVAALGDPEFFSITPQVVIDCRILRLTGSVVEVAFDARRDALPNGMARSIYELLVQSIREVIDCGRPVLGLTQPMLDERAAVNSTPPVATPGCLHDPFRARVRETPDDPAILWDPELNVGSDEAGVMTYADLDERARRLAAVIADRVDPGAIVAIRLPKGPEQIIAVLGVLYAGCTYLPIGIGLPDNRAHDLIIASGAALTLTGADLDAAAGREPLVEPIAPDPSDLAYVIYTSGSTGAPKGVAISHAAALNTVLDVNARNSISPEDRILAVSALDFDLSVYDIFGPLATGASVVTISDGARRDAFVWGRLVRDLGITVWNSVPGLVEMLLAANDELPSLRRVLCSGDWIKLDLFTRLRAAAPHAVLVCMGGATEASIWSNEYVIESEEDIDPDWASIPYGCPLSGQKYRVVAEDGQDCPNGVVGELWIGGRGVADGYHRAPELTSASFVTDDRGCRWYRTGDLGMWHPGAFLFLIGRLDTQVKIRGHRIECGEVEHALRRLDGVATAVVTPIRDRTALGAVVIADDAHHRGDISRTLQAELRRVLPEYMVPAEIVVRPALEYTPNGKIDRAWAQDQFTVSPALRPTAAATTVERVWCDILGLPGLIAEDNFFALGGDSLDATRVCAALRAQGIHVGVDQLFAHPTLGDFAAACPDPLSEPSPISPEPTEPSTDRFPLTPLQRAYALGADGIVGVVQTAPRYSTVIRSAAPIDFTAWGQAITQACATLEPLRCIRDGETHQRITAHEDRDPIVWLNGTGDAAEALRARLVAPDPMTDRVLAAVAVRGHEHEIGLSIDYLGLDARSIMVILDHIVALATSSPAPSAIDPSARVFRSFAERNAEQEDTLANGVLDLRPPLLHTGDIPRGPVPVRSRRLRLGLDEAEALAQEAKRQQVTASALLLAVFGRTLAECTGVDEIDISVPMSHRSTDSDGTCDEVLGNFTQLALCRCGPAIDAAAVHRSLGRAVSGFAPGERDISRAGRAAFPVVFTSTLGLRSAHDLVHGDPREVWSHTSTPGVLIDCQVVPRQDGIEVRWDHPDGVLESGFLNDAFAQFADRVRGLAGSPRSAGSLDLPATLRHCAEITPPQETRPELRPVRDRWASEFSPSSGEPDPASSRFLHDCLIGGPSAEGLLEHDWLSPEALLVQHLESFGVLEELRRSVQACAERVGRRVTVAYLGTGTGRVFAAVSSHLSDTDLDWVQIETSARLRSAARSRGLAPQPTAPDQPCDLILAIGTLHRDPRLAEQFTRIPLRPGAETILIEIPRADAASLVAALVDPRIAGDSTESPLHPTTAWWAWLEENGWTPDAAHEPTPHLSFLHACHPVPTSTGPDKLAVRPGPAGPSHRPQRPDEVESLLIDLWTQYLPDQPVPITGSDDFFALGGDSLAATRVLSQLHTRGLTGVKLADLFNISRLTELAEHIADTPTDDTTNPSLLDEASSVFPLTNVQKAYLTGRDRNQLLGGVAAHCYFEFDAPGLDRDRFASAVTAVVMRHPALRTTIDSVDGSLSGQVGDRPAHPPVEVVDEPREMTAQEVPDPSVRGALAVRLPRDGSSVIAVGMDNLMLDGTSMWRVLRDIDAVYNGQELPELPQTSFADYVRARPWLYETAPRPDDQAHWDQNPPPGALRLVGLEEILALTDRPRFARAADDLDGPAWQSVRAAAAHHRITPAALVLAAYASELRMLTSQENFAINVTRFDRDPLVPGIDAVVGDFTTLTLVGIDARDDLVGTARSAQSQLATARDHPTVSAIDLQRQAVRATGDPVRGLQPVVYTCGLGLDPTGRASDDFGFGRLVSAESQTPQTVLDLQVHDDSRGLHITADYVTQLLPAEAITSVVTGVVRRLRELTQTTADSAVVDTIRKVWCEVLGADFTAGEENFFRAGGDSLRATQCVRRLQDDLDSRITLRILLANPDLDAFAAAVAALISQPADPHADLEEGAL